MAGELPGFDPDEFRDAIAFAMNLGAPVDADRQATFYRPAVVTATGPTDADNVPYGPDTQVSAEPPTPVRVPCGVEEKGSDLIVTLLDVHYAQVAGFTQLLYSGRPYANVEELPEAALGSVGIHQFLCRPFAGRVG